MPSPADHTPVTAPLSVDEAEALAESMRVFATAGRLRILYSLLAGERTVEELAEATGMAPSAVSQHLRMLRHLRFAAVQRAGRHSVYRLYDEHVAQLLKAIRHHAEHAELGWVEEADARAAAP
jgi:DNA-binding transcriptional ArsR family regulator